MARGQAERLLPLLEALLAEAGLAWRDLAAIGVGTGPGNFTGLRIAVAAARGLALGLGIPAVGIPAADALGDGLGPVTVALPAPGGRVHLLHGGLIHVASPGEAPPPGWPRRVAGPAAGLVGGAAVVDAAPLAPTIARLALRRAVPGGPRPVPLYARPADAAPPADPPPAVLDG